MTKKEEAELKRAQKLEAERTRIAQMKVYEHQIASNLLKEKDDDPTGAPAILICGVDEAGRGPFAGPVSAGAVILDLEDPAREILYLNDSKKLSEKKREQLYREIFQKAIAVGFGYSGVRTIDSINILQATYRAMRMAIANLTNVSHLVTEEDDTHSLVSKLIRYEVPQSLHAEQDNSSENNPEVLSEASLQTEKQAATDQGNNNQTEDISFMKQGRISTSVRPDYILADAVTIPEIRIPQQGIVKGDAKSVSIAAASIIAKVTRDHIMYEYDKTYPEYGFASHKGYGTAAHIDAIKQYGMTPIHRRSFIHFDAALRED